MAGNRTLKLNILAETKDLIKGLNDADKATSSAGDKIKKGFKIAAAAIAAAGAAAIAFGVKSIKVAEEAATANARIAQINESMGLFGSSVGQVNERLIAYAEATARATGIDQNSIKATQAKLLTFQELAKSANQVGGEFDRATQAAIDLAAAGFGSAETNAAQLGKALQDPIKGLTALSRSGVTFTETERERIKTLVESNQVGEAQRLVLEAIEKQVGGTAEATANASDKIRVTFDLLTEKIGMALLPIFERFSAFLIDEVVPVIERYVVPVVTKLADQFNKNVTPNFEKVNRILKDFVIPTIQALWKFITDYFYPAIRNLLTPVIDILRKAFEFLSGKVNENRETFDKAFAIMLNIFAFVRDHLAPVVGNVLATAFNLITRAIGLAIDNFVKVFGIIEKVAKFLGFDLDLALNTATKSVNNLDSGIVDAYKSFSEQSKGIKEEVIPSLFGATDATNSLTSSTNQLAGASKAATAALKEQFTAAQALDLIRSGFGSAVGAQSIGKLPGGESFRSAAELVGQFGGFIPGFNQLPTDPFYGFGKGSSLGTFQKGATNVVNINVSGTVVDPEGAARAIQQVIRDSGGRAGNLPLTPAGLAFE